MKRLVLDLILTAAVLVAVGLLAALLISGCETRKARIYNITAPAVEPSPCPSPDTTGHGKGRGKGGKR